MSRYILGIDLGASLGVAKVYFDGRAEAHTVRIKETTLSGRVRAVSGAIKTNTRDGACVGVCVEEPFSGQFSSVKALFPMMGAAALTCEELGLPWSVIHLTKLKKHATGKGNAKKPDMQAAAKARFGLDFKEDEADAVWAAAFALDNDLFTE